MTTTDSHLQISPTEDGINIDGSILWLDSKSNGEISFLSSVHLMDKNRTKQVIISKELEGLLELQGKPHNGLVVDYNRQFAIGKYFIELLPSGSGLGDSIFKLSSDNEKMIYAPKIQLDKISLFRQLQISEADTLILGAYFPYSSDQIGSRKKEKEKLLGFIQNARTAKKSVVLVCDEYSTAPELTEYFQKNRVNFEVHGKIQKISKYHRQLGYDLDRVDKLTKLADQLHIIPNTKKIKYDLEEQNAVIIHVSSIPFESFKPRNLGEPTAKFFLPNCSYGKSLKDFIAKVNPGKIYFHGPYAKEYQEALNNRSTETNSLFPNHMPSLF